MLKRVILLLILAAALAVPAAAKEGAQAHLLTKLPAHAPAGSWIVVGWKVDVPGPNGTRRPFSASDMFVQLTGGHGARTRAFASQATLSGPPFHARITVPPGGIYAIRFGLMGEASTPTGSHPAPMWFPLVR